MSETEFGKIIKKIMVSVILFTVFNLIIVIGGVWKSSSDNSLINKYQDKELQETKKDLHDFKDETKAQYYRLTEAIKELNDKL